jgi:hypothetical protein
MDHTAKIFLFAGIVSVIGSVAAILIITKLKEIDAFYKIFDKKKKDDDDNYEIFC